MTQDLQPETLTIDFDSFSDARGVLTVEQNSAHSPLPFRVDRVFWITDVPQGATRGNHAHQTCYEALVCVHGSFKVKVDNGCGLSFTDLLDSPQKGLVVPPMVWCELLDFTPGAVCLCMASGGYDKDGYLETREEWLAALR